MLRRLSCISAALLLLGAPLAADEAADSLRAAELAFAASVAERDAEAFASFLDEDAVFVTNVVLRGREAILQGWAVFFAEGGPKLVWEPQTVEVRPDGLGLSRGPYTLTVTDCPGCEDVDATPDWSFAVNNQSVFLTNTSTGATITQTVIDWNDGSPLETFPGNWTQPVNHSFALPGIYNVCLRLISEIGGEVCETELCQSITVNPDPCLTVTPSWFNLAFTNNACSYVFNSTTIPANVQLSWDFGDGSPTQSGTSVTHTFPSNGLYYVSLAATFCSPGLPPDCCTETFTAPVLVDGCSGGIAFGSRMAGNSSLSWNAVNAELQVDLGNAGSGPVRVAVFGMDGKLLKEAEVGQSGRARFDLSGLPSGVYLVRTSSAGQVTTQKFWKP